MMRFMRQLIVFQLALLAFQPVGVAGVPDAEAWLKQQPPLYRVQDPARIDSFLRQLHVRFPDFNQALSAVARARVGTPYVLGCLGEEKGKDKGPLFRLDVADCTVFVLTSTALARSSSLREAREWMKKLNYYAVAAGEDPVRYENRIHFTEDRLQTSPYFKDITAAVAPASVRKVELTLNLTASGKRLIDIPWQKRVTLSYVPAAQVDAAILSRLPSPCGVAFVRQKNLAKGLLVGHEGLVLDRHLLVDASSVKKQVEATDFRTYLQGDPHPYFDGVIFYAIS
jgi:hypothetical protein